MGRCCTLLRVAKPKDSDAPGSCSEIPPLSDWLDGLRTRPSHFLKETWKSAKAIAAARTGIPPVEDWDEQARTHPERLLSEAWQTVRVPWSVADGERIARQYSPKGKLKAEAFLNP